VSVSVFSPVAAGFEVDRDPAAALEVEGVVRRTAGDDVVALTPDEPGAVGSTDERVVAPTADKRVQRLPPTSVCRRATYRKSSQSPPMSVSFPSPPSSSFRLRRRRDRRPCPEYPIVACAR
jgi:hypothetical protein